MFQSTRDDEYLWIQYAFTTEWIPNRRFKFLIFHSKIIIEINEKKKFISIEFYVLICIKYMFDFKIIIEKSS